MGGFKIDVSWLYTSVPSHGSVNTLEVGSALPARKHRMLALYVCNLPVSTNVHIPYVPSGMQSFARIP